MIVQVQDKGTGKHLGYLAGYAIFEGMAFALVAKAGEPLKDYKIEDLVVIRIVEVQE